MKKTELKNNFPVIVIIMYERRHLLLCTMLFLLILLSFAAKNGIPAKNPI